MRTWPGPRFWSSLYGLLTFLQVGWPGWALASATAIAALVLGRIPTADDAGVVKLLGYLTFGLCVLILVVGRRIERNLEYAMWVLMSVVFGYLLFVDSHDGVDRIVAQDSRRVRVASALCRPAATGCCSARSPPTRVSAAWRTRT